ncbi:MAG: glycerophosphoryl diester phosphodiesterase membrane domain-containing protein, partial [Vallitaleaceae bacterium]|nr:glycerophosphoryl diester phosphodiesterase membrane domain-containing protein [Vallitaleaceae bacterium]
MFAQIKEGMEDFRKIYKQLLSFQFFYFLITSLVFVPMIAAIFNRTLKSMGAYSLLNQDIYKLGFNYRGIIGIVLIAIVSVIIIFIQFGICVVLSQKQYFNTEVSLVDALVTTVKRIPKIFGLGILQIMFFLLFLIPVVDSPLATSLLQSINIPIWVTSKILASDWFILVYAIGLLISGYMVLRWIFTLHYIIIENKPSRKAIRSSQKLTKHNEIRIVLALILFNIVLIGVGLGFIALINRIPILLRSHINSDLLVNYFIALSGYLTFGMTLLLTPINILWLTRLFYRFGRVQGDEVSDHLKLSHISILNRFEQKLIRFFGARKYLIMLLLTVYFTITFILSYSATEDILRWNVQIASHRGDGFSAPENSMSSIQSALAKGVDAIEIDIQMTKDGILVLNHDLTLKRIARVDYKVSELTYEELQKIDIGDYYAVYYKDEFIPTLDSVLDAAKGKAQLIIEIKSYSYNQELVEKLVQSLQEHDMVEQCMVQSFSYQALKAVRKLDSAIRIGQIIYVAAGNLNKLDVDFYTIKQVILSDTFVANAHRQGRQVWVWTVNNEINIK